MLAKSQDFLGLPSYIWLGVFNVLFNPSAANLANTGELGYDGLNGTRKIGPSYAKSVVYIWRILDMHRTGTKHIVRHLQKSVVQWSVISKFTCTKRYKNMKNDWNLSTWVLIREYSVRAICPWALDESSLSHWKVEIIRMNLFRCGFLF